MKNLLLSTLFMMVLSLGAHAQSCNPSLVGIWKIANSEFERAYGGYYEFTEDKRVICYKGVEVNGQFRITKVLGEGVYDYNTYYNKLTLKDFTWNGLLALANGSPAEPEVFRLSNVGDDEFEAVKDDLTRNHYVRVGKFRYYLTIVARKGSQTGHLYAQWIKVSAWNTQAVAYGFYPRSTASMVFGLISDERGKIVNEYSTDNMFVETATFRIEISAREYENTIGLARNDYSTRIYDLKGQNCISFVSEVLKRVNVCKFRLNVPTPKSFQFPADYLIALKKANPKVAESSLPF